MHTALIAPSWLPVPPPAHGRTGSVGDNLTLILVARGHDVHLFTMAESACPVPGETFFARAAERRGTSVAAAAHVLAAYDEVSAIDIVHDRTLSGRLSGPQQRLGVPPVVLTTGPGRRGPLSLLRTALRFGPHIPGNNNPAFTPALPPRFLPLRRNGLAAGDRVVTIDITPEDARIQGLDDLAVRRPPPRRL